MTKIIRALIAALALLPCAAFAQSWPTKPVKIISVFPPGGSVDQVARILAAQLSQQLGTTFIVDDRGGASGSIGTQVVASSPPDGYTFGVVFDTHAVNPSLLQLPFDTLKDLAPVMLIGTSPMAIVAHPSQPYKDFRDVLAAAKTQKGGVSFGSIGTGSLGHLAMAQIGDITHTQFTHIPYRGGGPLMTDAVGGQVPVAIGTVFLVNPHVRAGKLKALAGDSDARAVLVTGSHGALLGGRADTMLAVDAFAAFFNDAGGGKEGAGYTRLAALDQRGMAAATVSCDSARIGDGRSTYETGVLSRVNESARRLELAEGMTCREAVARLVGLA